MEYAWPQTRGTRLPADSRWRTEPLQGREAIEAFLTRKRQRQLDYRLIKETCLRNWVVNSPIVRRHGL